MTFAELVLALAAGALLVLVMRPLQRRLERRLTHFFRSRSSGRGKPVIDITDFSKKKDRPKP